MQPMQFGATLHIQRENLAELAVSKSIANDLELQLLRLSVDCLMKSASAQDRDRSWIRLARMRYDLLRAERKSSA